MLGPLTGSVVSIVASYLEPWDLQSLSLTSSVNAAFLRETSTWVTMYRHQFLGDQYEPFATRTLQQAREEFLWHCVTSRRLTARHHYKHEGRDKLCRSLARKRCSLCNGRHFTRHCSRCPCNVCHRIDCTKRFLSGKFYQCQGPCRAFRSTLLQCDTRGAQSSWSSRTVALQDANLSEPWRCTACDHPFHFGNQNAGPDQANAEEVKAEECAVVPASQLRGVFSSEPEGTDSGTGTLEAFDRLLHEPEPQVSARPPSYHPCNVCLRTKDTQGIRFKCGNCANYELCLGCWEKDTHEPTHVFLAFRKPLSIYERARMTKPLLSMILLDEEPAQSHFVPDMSDVVLTDKQQKELAIAFGLKDEDVDKIDDKNDDVTTNSGEDEGDLIKFTT